jgi:hypothetical protein
LVKASRRAILRGVFSGSGFRLTHDVANEVLMRVNRSLDPEPLTERMWASYVAIRREGSYATHGRRPEANGPDRSVAPEDPADVHLRELPEHVARDFAFLLRVEELLKSWSSVRTTDIPAATRAGARDEILAGLAREIRRYSNDCEDTAAYRLEVRDPIIRCLAQAVGIEA